MVLVDLLPHPGVQQRIIEYFIILMYYRITCQRVSVHSLDLPAHATRWTNVDMLGAPQILEFVLLPPAEVHTISYVASYEYARARQRDPRIIKSRRGCVCAWDIYSNSPVYRVIQAFTPTYLRSSKLRSNNMHPHHDPTSRAFQSRNPYTDSSIPSPSTPGSAYGAYGPSRSFESLAHATIQQPRPPRYSPRRSTQYDAQPRAGGVYLDSVSRSSARSESISSLCG